MCSPFVCSSVRPRNGQLLANHLLTDPPRGERAAMADAAVDIAGAAGAQQERCAAAPPATLFRTALEKLPTVKDADGNITTEGFVELCELTAPLIGAPAAGGVAVMRSCLL